MDYALSATVNRPFVQTLEATRVALSDQGFGVLTEVAVDARERLTAAQAAPAALTH